MLVSQLIISCTDKTRENDFNSPNNINDDRSRNNSYYLNILISQFINENGDRVERVVSISSCHFGFCCSYRMALLCCTTGFLLEKSGCRALPPPLLLLLLLLSRHQHNRRGKTTTTQNEIIYEKQSYL